MLSLPIELPTTCSLATELPTLPIQSEQSCLFCLLDGHWLLNCLLCLFSWNAAAYSPYCLFIGYWGAYSAYSVGTARELPILPTTCSLAGIELGTSSSRGKCTNYTNHALHGLLLKKKNLFTERANSFLEELLMFGKGLKTRETKSCFQQNALDHGQVNSNLLDWVTNAEFGPLWYLMIMYW